MSRSLIVLLTVWIALGSIQAFGDESFSSRRHSYADQASVQANERPALDDATANDSTTQPAIGSQVHVPGVQQNPSDPSQMPFYSHPPIDPCHQMMPPMVEHKFWPNNRIDPVQPTTGRKFYFSSATARWTPSTVPHDYPHACACQCDRWAAFCPCGTGCEKSLLRVVNERPFDHHHKHKHRAGCHCHACQSHGR